MLAPKAASAGGGAASAGQKLFQWVRNVKSNPLSKVIITYHMNVGTSGPTSTLGETAPWKTKLFPRFESRITRVQSNRSTFPLN